MLIQYKKNSPMIHRKSLKKCNTDEAAKGDFIRA